METAKYVSIDEKALLPLADDIIKKQEKLFYDFEESTFHYVNEEKPDLVVDYVFILDAMNFCFWPVKPLGYKDLASLLKQQLTNNPSLFKPKNLISLDFSQFKNQIFNSIDYGLMKERYQIIQDTAWTVLQKFEGEFSNVVKTGQNSVVKLLEILT